MLSPAVSQRQSQESTISPAGCSFAAVPDLPAAEAVAEAGPIVVWMRGEHDISTDGSLCQSLARAIALDRPVVLDLSEVNFIGASTLGVIVAARELLSRQSRSLTVRSASAFVRRIIGVCGLDNLFDPITQGGRKGAVEVPSTWQAAPVAEEAKRELESSHKSARARLPVDVSHAAHLDLPAVEPQRLAETA